MRRTALLIAGLTALCFACSPPAASPGGAEPPATSPPLPPPAAIAAAPLPAGCALNSVKLLPASFDPSSLTQTPSSVTAPPNSLVNDLLAAVAVAPPFFQKWLCKLDGIFITQGSDSWGFRNIRTGRRFIALSTSLWAGNPPAVIPLGAYANDVLLRLTVWPASDPSIPVYLPATPNSGAMTVLAAMAHEFGHVLWADILIDPIGSQPNFANFCPGTFPGSAWASLSAPKRWRPFGDVTDTPVVYPNDPNDDPNIPPASDDPAPQDIRVGRLLSALHPDQARTAPNFPRAHKILAFLLAKTRPWPGLFGAFSANEDFVESFELYTLTHAATPLTSLPLQISLGTRTAIRDVPATIGVRPRLVNVLQCFDNWITAHP